jgi:disulfide bond formation protein DsbB
MIMIIVIGMTALIIKDFTPKLKFPAFAWASMIGLLLTMPFMPTSKFILQYTNEVSFLGTTTPILAFAGISVGMKIARLKQLSWRLVIVAFCVFLGTFFGSAVIANIVLKIQGII